MDLEATVAALAPGLLRYCLGRTGDRALAEEVAQEALGALVGRVRAGEAPRSAAAFVFAVARRRAWRARWRRGRLAPLDEASAGAGSEPDPEARAAGRQRLRRVAAALRRLGGRDREALLLVGVAGLDGATACRLLGISPPALKMRVSRARRRLIRLLEEADAPTPGRSAGLRRLAATDARPRPADD